MYPDMANRYKIIILAAFFIILIDTDVDAQQEGDIRLAGPGSNLTHGRVEVYHNNTWGTVCDDRFQVNEAIVVCRQLGHSTSGASVLSADVYGPGSGVIWMDDVTCDALEDRLVDCQFGGWGQSDCTHSEDVGVACTALSLTPVPPTTAAPTLAPVVPETGNCTQPDPTIRLLGPVNRRGIGVVQVFQNGIWGGLCDDDWDINDARVVCRMLCYDAADALPGSEYIDTSNITEPMVINSIQCAGTEMNISSCPQSDWAVDSCGRNEMATVTCIPINYSPVTPEPILMCTDGLLTASFSRVTDPYLERKHLTIASSSGVPCNLLYGNSTTDVSIGIPFDECNTTRTTNATHIIYNNTIKYASTYTSAGGTITYANTYLVKVECILPREVIANKPIVPLTETVTQSAQGEFVVSLQFYLNGFSSPPVTQFPLELPVGRILNVALLLDDVDSTLRLVVHNCTATPTANRNDQIRYPLFIDKCVEDPDTVLVPLNDTWFGWRYRTFKFVQYGEVHIHCAALVCGQEETNPDCDRSCFRSTTTSATVQGPTSGRKKRSAARGYHTVYVSSPTLLFYNEPISTPAIERPPFTIIAQTTGKVTTNKEVTQGTILTTSSTNTTHRLPLNDSQPSPTAGKGTANTVVSQGITGTTSSTKASIKSSSWPIASQKTSLNVSQTPPTTMSNPSSTSPSANHTTGHSENVIHDPGLVISNVWSRASVVVFSLFGVTQFIMCLILFYILI